MPWPWLERPVDSTTWPFMIGGTALSGSPRWEEAEGGCRALAEVAATGSGQVCSCVFSLSSDPFGHSSLLSLTPTQSVAAFLSLLATNPQARPSSLIHLGCPAMLLQVMV